MVIMIFFCDSDDYENHDAFSVLASVKLVQRVKGCEAFCREILSGFSAKNNNNNYHQVFPKTITITITKTKTASKVHVALGISSGVFPTQYYQVFSTLMNMRLTQLTWLVWHKTIVWDGMGSDKLSGTGGIDEINVLVCSPHYHMTVQKPLKSEA